MSHEFSEISTAQTADAQREGNPYASPLTSGPLLAKNEHVEPVGIWRASGILIMHRAAVLPQRCVITNALCEPSERQEMTLDSRRNARIAQAIIGLIGGLISIAFLLSNFPERHMPAFGSALLSFLLIALFTMRKPFELKFAYSIKGHVRLRRRLWRRLGVGFFLAGLVTFIFLPPVAQARYWSNFSLSFGVLLMLAGAVALLVGRFHLRIERPPGNYLLIYGCGREFARNFPEAAIGLPFLGRISPKPFL